ncbi:SMUG1 [Cordylochernes scorpioides]|uniref:SMUG1 n=1 Tax=Cordylochernes scorpioides TaxID=51811 RepID=A0ABY6KNH4_9ARAC|nr:SMUG1 [Cordylochernes scorpioides]
MGAHSIHPRVWQVSGQRFWGLFKELCGEPDVFFSHCLVHNYCPLVFMAESGKNIALPQLPKGPSRDALRDICDNAMRSVVELLQPQLVVGVGKYAAERCSKALPATTVHTLMHPSPANPATNCGAWAPAATAQLSHMGVLPLLSS